MHGLSTSLMLFVFIGTLVAAFLSLKFAAPRIERNGPRPLLVSLVVAVAAILVVMIVFQLIGMLV